MGNSGSRIQENVNNASVGFMKVIRVTETDVNLNTYRSFRALRRLDLLYQQKDLFELEAEIIADEHPVAQTLPSTITSRIQDLHEKIFKYRLGLVLDRLIEDFDPATARDVESVKVAFRNGFGTTTSEEPSVWTRCYDSEDVVQVCHAADDISRILINLIQCLLRNVQLYITDPIRRRSDKEEQSGLTLVHYKIVLVARLIVALLIGGITCAITISLGSTQDETKKRNAAVSSMVIIPALLGLVGKPSFKELILMSAGINALILLFIANPVVVMAPTASNTDLAKT